MRILLCYSDTGAKCGVRECFSGRDVGDGDAAAPAHEICSNLENVGRQSRSGRVSVSKTLKLSYLDSSRRGQKARRCD